MSPKKWYERPLWDAISKGLAVLIIAILTQFAARSEAANDSTGTRTAITVSDAQDQDSLWRCVNRLTEEFRTHNAQQREQWIRDSLNSMFQKQEVSYIREDMKDIKGDVKRLLQIQSRNFAAR